MAIIKDVTVKINNGTATLDAPVQFYEKDHDVELRFRLMDYKYKYDKDPQNILNSVDEDILEAYTTIVNPRGYELEQINGVVKNDVVIFRLDPTYTDELDELGTYKLQIHIKCTHSEFTIPPITFEVLQRLKGIKVVTDGEDEVDDSEILDNSSKFVSDETGKLIIEWKKGDMISSAKLNAMVDVINDAVDEEKIRQENEIEREKKANNKIQELENTRVEYVNKFDTELDSFADQVDESMTDYETRFNAMTVSQQQDAEIIDARDGEQTLRARLERDIQKPYIIYEEVEGSYINAYTTSGYAQNVEILGNTIQNQNDLADIRSVGDKLENQELYEIPVLSANKNLFSYDFYDYSSYSQLDKAYVLKEIKLPVGIITISNKKIKDQTSDMGTLIMQFWDNTSYSTSNRNPMINSGWSASSQKIVTIEEGKKYYIAINITGNTLSKETILEKIKDMYEIQIEVGNTITPYEPYQEDKLTILSPVQLEKVGDVADRIVCKDGVWGVEKNIARGVIETIGSVIDTSENFTGVAITIPNIQYQNRGNVITLEGFATFTESDLTTIPIYSIYCNTSNLVACFPKGTSPTDMRAHLIGRNYICITTQPQFIPLPHDQQIKLRTFANKTNIHFLTEIEPTLKASVPKSLGASVSSHSEQIDNLGKELNKVKKLEESVASEVITESDFITVENTSNGYFEDVKLEGKTLVNLANAYNTVGTGSDKTKYTFDGEYYSIQKTNGYTLGIAFKSRNDLLEANKTYTIIINNKSEIQTFLYDVNYSKISNLSNGINIIKFTPSISQPIRVGDINNNSSEGLIKFAIVLLEGDHTQNPPSYFEGLKSVGQDVDEISVESIEENIVKYTKKTVKSDGYACDFESISSNDVYYHNLSNKNIRLHIKKDDTYVKNIIIPPKTTIQHELSNGNVTYSVSLTLGFGWELQEYDIDRIFAITRKNLADKKPLLYYNPTTDTWEKPILRQWDSIEKHSDGKYYYHKRSEEVVLNGSEDWGLRLVNPDDGIHVIFSLSISSKYNKSSYMICDRFNTLPAISLIQAYSYGEGLSYYTSSNQDYLFYYVVNKSKLSTQDVEGFKSWLQANPTTVVYQLAEEKVYECTDLDLITYQNETNLMVKGGAIVPKTTLKVHKNIANIATILQEKVNRLENNVGHATEVFSNINTDLTSLTESIEGSCISVDSKDGYLKDIEILGNTVQDQDNLADIRSVGDKVEGQELYEIPVLCTGKNLININDIVVNQGVNTSTGNFGADTSRSRTPYIKFNPNTNYITTNVDVLIFYDKNKQFISSNRNSNGVSPDNCKYIVVRMLNTTTDWQLELGTVATPYEPYQGDKLTILSPVQLEKVGDVADRIICKDGVWGIEKNINTINFNTDLISYTYELSEKQIQYYTLDNVIADAYANSDKTNNINSFCPSIATNNRHTNSGIACFNANWIGFSMPKTLYPTIEDFKNAIPEYIEVKYKLAEPQFIPLPHDQQIKLRTFANKTNISFRCEIEPTLKASVPKSLSSTVSTHTEQIDNLGKELDKVKKLEESVASEVITESDFTTVTETSNGYFEDVKLEGKTLVNLYPKLDANNYSNLGVTLSNDTITINANGSWRNFMLKKNVMPLKTSTYYTFVIYIIDNTITGNDPIIHFGDTLPKDPSKFRDSYHFSLKNKKGIYAFKLKTKDSFDNVSTDTRDHLTDKATSGTIVFKYMILEGDHTQNPPEFFEGIKSVGQDVDEISVLSCNENLFDVKSVIEKYPSVLTPFGNGFSAINGVYNLTYLIPDVNKQYTISWHGEPLTQSVSIAYIGFSFIYTDGTSEYVIDAGDKKISSTKGKTIKEFRITYSHSCTMNLTNISLVEGDTPKPYQPHKQDKKPLLYYNPTTDTWEKPILRQWDSIEKHSDGKYYYHKRSEEVVLNGSEDWGLRTDLTDDGVNTGFSFNTSFKYNKSSYMICDKFNPKSVSGANEAYSEGEGIAYYNYSRGSEYVIYYVISKSKLSSQDVAGFKAWLQANPTTLVYQLEEEKVYECTSIDLITYENETNFIVNTGAITPKSTLKVMCNINNVVRELQQKVSNLENYIQHVMIDALNNALNE